MAQLLRLCKSIARKRFVVVDVTCDACGGTGERPNGDKSHLSRLCLRCMGRGSKRVLRLEDERED